MVPGSRFTHSRNAFLNGVGSCCPVRVWIRTPLSNPDSPNYVLSPFWESITRTRQLQNQSEMSQIPSEPEVTQFATISWVL